MNRLTSFFVSTNLKGGVAKLWAGAVAFLFAGVSFCHGDRSVAIAVENAPKAVAEAATMLSVIAQPFFLLPICLLLYGVGVVRPAYLKLSRFGLFGFNCALVSLVIVLVVKHAIGRARPNAALNWDPALFLPFSFEDAFASFPSAQSACAAAVFIGAAGSFPRLRRQLHLCSAALCGARVLTGEHWVSGVMVGWAIGWLVVRGFARFALWRK